MLWEQGVGGPNPLAPTIKKMAYGLGRSPFFVWASVWYCVGDSLPPTPQENRPRPMRTRNGTPYEVPFLFFSGGKFSSHTFSVGSFCWSPKMVVSGQNSNAGHFSHPTARATGQIFTWVIS